MLRMVFVVIWRMEKRFFDWDECMKREQKRRSVNGNKRGSRNAKTDDKKSLGVRYMEMPVLEGLSGNYLVWVHE